MTDRQFIAARMVAETLRWLAPPLPRPSSRYALGRAAPQLGLGHPRIDGNYRSVI